MITYLTNDVYENDENEVKNIVEIACLHADTKPTDGIVTGSLALEVDTGDIYAFDEAGGEWNKISGASGGSDDDGGLV